MTASLRTQAALAVAAAAAALAPAAGCAGGDIALFGYSTKARFDPNIKSVYIPQFKTIAFHTNPYRGVGADVTQAIVEELNSRRTPMRVVQDPALADTELVGTITNVTKNVYLRNLQNLNRDFDVVFEARVVWRDLRTGRVYSGGRQPQPPVVPEGTIDPTVPQAPPPAPDPGPTPVVITGIGKVVPELGESNATGEQKALKQIARRIVDMMETPW